LGKKNRKERIEANVLMLGVLGYERTRARFENTSKARGRSVSNKHIPRVEFYLGMAAHTEMASWNTVNSPGAHR
jgi:hypothetical protein